MIPRRGFSNYADREDGSLDIPESTRRRWKKLRATETCPAVQYSVPEVAQSSLVTEEEVEFSRSEDDTMEHCIPNSDSEDLDAVEIDSDSDVEGGPGAESTHQEVRLLDPTEEAFAFAVLQKRRKYHGTKQQLGTDLLMAHTILLTISATKTSSFPKSLYRLKSMYNEVLPSDLLIHYICPRHGAFLGTRAYGEKTNVDFVCDIAGDEQHVLALKDLHQSSLLSISIESQLTELFQVKGEEIERGIACRQAALAGNCSTAEFVQGKFYRTMQPPPAEYDITIIAHMDGASKTDSSNLKLYTIHWTVAELSARSRQKTGLLHSVWVGQCKDMPNRKSLLLPFLQEMDKLSTIGMTRKIKDVEVRFRVYCVCVIADVMERAPLAGIFSIHSSQGCCACEACTETISDPNNPRSHRQVYRAATSTSAKQRDDKETDDLGRRLDKMSAAAREIARKDPVFKGICERSVLSPLERFIVTRCLPPDIMHMIFGGIMPKLSGWSKALLANFGEIDFRSAELDVPSVMSRKYRTIGDWKKFQTNEWRNILPVVLFLFWGNLPPREFRLWALLLSVTLTASKDTMTKRDTDTLDQEASTLIAEFEKVCGADFMVYNVHQLKHLAQACRYFGSAAGFCAFACEDWIGKMKKNIKGFNQITRELANNAVLDRITNHLAAKVSGVKWTPHIENLLSHVSQFSSHHKYAKTIAGVVVLGKPFPFKKLEKLDTDSHTALATYVAQHHSELLPFSPDFEVYDKAIVSGQIISAKVSSADKLANSLVYTQEMDILRFRHALLVRLPRTEEALVLFVCVETDKDGTKPFGLQWYLPGISLFSWTKNHRILHVREIAGCAIEMPYRPEVGAAEVTRIGCCLPRTLFSCD